MNGFTTKLIVCYPVNNKLGRFQALEIYHSKYSRVHLNKILIVFFLSSLVEDTPCLNAHTYMILKQKTKAAIRSSTTEKHQRTLHVGQKIIS